MRKLFVLSFMSLILVLAVSVPVMAESVVGCPLGLEEGKFWFRSQFIFMSADEALWNPDSHKDTPEMISLPEDWKAKIITQKYRFGYGISDRFDIGIALTYVSKDIKKQVWKKQGDTWEKKWKEIDASGLSETWFSAKYKLAQNEGDIEALAIGVGIKPDNAGADDVRNTIATGTDDVRLVLLTHNPLSSRLHLCSHFWYQFPSNVRQIDKYKKSGWKLGQKTNYKVNFEYGLNKAGTLGLNLAFIGNRKSADKKPDGSKVPNSNQYEDALFLKLVYMPEGEENEHRKAFIGVKMPYNVKKGFSADFIPVGVFMWTW